MPYLCLVELPQTDFIGLALVLPNLVALRRQELYWAVSSRVASHSLAVPASDRVGHTRSRLPLWRGVQSALVAHLKRRAQPYPPQIPQIWVLGYVAQDLVRVLALYWHTLGQARRLFDLLPLPTYALK